MSKSDSDPDSNADLFKLYITCDTPSETISSLLDTEGYDEDPFDYEQLPGRTAQEVCQHHRETLKAGSDIHSRLILIFDRDDAEKQGALLIDLKPYHGYPDAVRHLPEDAGNAIASLSIDNTSWYEERDSEANWDGNWAKDRFALYDLLPDGEDKIFKKAMRAMNDGVQQQNCEDPDSDEATDDPVNEDELNTYYVGIQPDSQDMTGIMAHHTAYADSHALDPSRYAVIDEKYDDEGALIIQIQPNEDAFRCKGPTAGEILRWIALGFMKWDQGKAFADGKTNYTS